MSFVPSILAIFSNPPKTFGEHLAYLDAEMEALKDIIEKRNNEKGVYIEYRPHADSVDNELDFKSVSSTIYSFRKKCTVIHYSGHADRSALSLQNTDLRAANFIQFISECDNLKVVILNACSTEGFVKKILERTNVRAVIATNNPVKDQTAKVFSEEFFKRFVQNESLSSSFINAVSNALQGDFQDDNYIFKADIKNNEVTTGKLLTDKTTAGKTRAVKKKYPSLFSNPDQEAKWGLYTRAEDILDWKLFENLTSTELQASELKEQIRKLNTSLNGEEAKESELLDGLEPYKNADEQTKKTYGISISIMEKELANIRNEIDRLKKQITDLEDERRSLSLEGNDDAVIKEYTKNLGSLNYETQFDFIDDQAGLQSSDIFRGFIMHGTGNCALDHLSRKVIGWLGINNDIERVFYDFTSGNIDDFWVVLKNTHMNFLQQNTPEAIIKELYKQFVDPNGETQKNFIFLFRNVAGKSGKDNNIERILEFWKKMLSLWDTMPPIKKLDHHIISFIIDNSCELTPAPPFKTSKQDAYASLINKDQLIVKSVSLMPPVSPIKEKQLRRWQIDSDIPGPLRYTDEQLKDIVTKTNGFFLPTVKEISVNKISIEAKKLLLLSYIKESIENP